MKLNSLYSWLFRRSLPPAKPNLPVDIVTPEHHVLTIASEPVPVDTASPFGPVPVEQIPGFVCKLPGCGVLTSHPGGYCSGDHHRRHETMIRKEVALAKDGRKILDRAAVARDRLDSCRGIVSQLIPMLQTRWGGEVPMSKVFEGLDYLIHTNEPSLKELDGPLVPDIPGDRSTSASLTETGLEPTSPSDQMSAIPSQPSYPG